MAGRHSGNTTFQKMVLNSPNNVCWEPCFRNSPDDVGSCNGIMIMVSFGSIVQIFSEAFGKAKYAGMAWTSIPSDLNHFPRMVGL